MKLRLALFGLSTLAALAGCEDECRSYSAFSCSEIEKASYNVRFYYPDGKEESLGRTEGLSNCTSMAYGFADSKNLDRNAEWSYTCCMRAKGSECYEKHR